MPSADCTQFAPCLASLCIHACMHHVPPTLTCLCLTAVLPDFERWPDNYVHISFDNDPVADHPRLAQLSPAQRREYAGENLIRVPELCFFCIMIGHPCSALP